MLEIVVALIGIGAVAVGALLTKHLERVRWERDRRLEAYVQFLTLTDEHRRQATVEEPDLASLDLLVSKSADALVQLLFVGSKEACTSAREMVGWVTALNTLAKTVPSEGDLLSNEAWKQLVDDRFEFISAARADLGMKATDISRGLPVDRSLEELKRVLDTAAVTSKDE